MIDKVIKDLEAEWEQDTGFLGKLRQGVFCGKSLSRLLKTLDGVETSESEEVNRRLVELLWYIPTFISWQKERALEKDKENLEIATTEILNRLEEVLGLP